MFLISSITSTIFSLNLLMQGIRQKITRVTTNRQRRRKGEIEERQPKYSDKQNDIGQNKNKMKRNAEAKKQNEQKQAENKTKNTRRWRETLTYANRHEGRTGSPTQQDNQDEGLLFGLGVYSVLYPTNHVTNLNEIYVKLIAKWRNWFIYRRSAIAGDEIELSFTKKYGQCMKLFEQSAKMRDQRRNWTWDVQGLEFSRRNWS